MLFSVPFLNLTHIQVTNCVPEIDISLYTHKYVTEQKMRDACTFCMSQNSSTRVN